MPTITITAGPSNRSLSETSSGDDNENNDEENFTLALDPEDLIVTQGGAEETIRVRYEFTGTPLWNNIVRKGHIDAGWYPTFFYRGFCCVGNFNLQLHIYNQDTREVIASSNVWSWEITE